MGLSSSLNAGVMGLAANSTKLNTISDNIANSETFGYKRAKSEFSSMVLEQSTGAYTAGGVRTATFKDIAAQGALVATNNSTDVSIAGSGLLPVTTIQGVNSTSADRPVMLTSTGSFSPDKDGLLRSLSGLYLMGIPADPDGTIPTFSRDSFVDLEPIDVTRNQFAAAPTENIQLGVNLPASETNAGSSGDSFELPIAYFDNLGGTDTLNVVFTPVVPGAGSSNQWNVQVFDQGSATPATSIGDFTVEFNDNQINGGTINDVTGLGSGAVWDAATGLLTVTTTAGDINLNLGIPNQGGPLSQLAAVYSPVGIEKDGAPIGSFSRVEIDENGFLAALFDNGFRRIIYQVPLAQVQNINGLDALDNQAFQLSQRSGNAFLWDAGTGPVGTTVGFSLTESTTDIAEELTDLIQTQRAYSSNAQIIRTVDEMLQETTNLKR